MLTKRLVLVSFFLASTLFGSAYDDIIKMDRPIAYWSLAGNTGNAIEKDLGWQSSHDGRYFPQNGAFKRTRLPNGDKATVFDGYTQYLEVPSALSLSAREGHALTLEAWIRPDTLEFPTQESDGYVHWAGKGESGFHEYALRMYSLTNSANRPNRISGYVFNPGGQKGSGSYFQDSVKKGEWIHVGLVIDGVKREVRLFKNGQLRKTTPFSQFDVSPMPGAAPLRIGTRDMHSFFKGAIGKFAVYTRALGELQFKAHLDRMYRK